MNILVIRGNPRKDGYTQHITSLFAEGAVEAGAAVDDIDILQKKITQCIGCYHCWSTVPGRCRFNDDMPDMLERILRSDAVICSTPLYYYTMSSAIKRFLERTLPLATQQFGETERGLMRNLSRYPERWSNKKLGFIAAGAFRNPANFDGLKATFRLMAGGFNMTICAEIIRPEAYLLQFELAKPKAVRTVETALKRAGAELATDGRVSEATQEKIALPLAVDLYHFRLYSDIYWQHAMALGKDASDLARVQQAVVGDVRVLMREMARSIDPVAAAKLRAVLQFDFPDKDLHFRISVDKGTCRLEQAASETCDLRVVVDTATWAGVFTRKVNVRDALMQKRIILEGDKALFSRLDRYFPPPVS
jgi:multimeric flavodoxin WrbA/putative sterol carrier protein